MRNNQSQQTFWPFSYVKNFIFCQYSKHYLDRVRKKGDRMTTNWHTARQIYRYTRQTYRYTDRHTDTQTDIQIHKTAIHADTQTASQRDIQIHKTEHCSENQRHLRSIPQMEKVSPGRRSLAEKYESPQVFIWTERSLTNVFKTEIRLKLLLKCNNRDFVRKLNREAWDNT